MKWTRFIDCLISKICQPNNLSGWLQLLSGVKVTGTGNQALWSGKEVSKTKYCYQVTAFVLNSLLKSPYDEAVLNGESADIHNLLIFILGGYRWKKKHPTFHYWSICLRMEMALFSFKRSIRSRNFVLYIYAIDGLLKWILFYGHRPATWATYCRNQRSRCCDWPYWGRLVVSPLDALCTRRRKDCPWVRADFSTEASRVRCVPSSWAIN